ncbi:hypothetical protein ACFSSA_14515 [Luteolibacter algae]|uniref:Uncharacterized protein n=2 Tax=Luteolibacter algae TaxID=454151 RepID=A0ABW5D9T5_9BACT
MPLMERPIFRAFREEANVISTGGYHDGVSTNIFLNHGKDPLVNLHENVHDRIFSSCPDARILAVLLFGERKEFAALEDKRAIPKFSELINAMYSASEFAHEVFATYLSIKVFHISEHSAQAMRYPRDYQKYYEFLSVPLDERLGSSYLQYLVANALMVNSFSTPFYRRFLRSLPQVITSLKFDENPNQRLIAMMDVLGSGDRLDRLLAQLQRIADEISGSNGFQTWNLQSEDAWIAANGQERQLIEYAISNFLFGWISREARLEMYEFDERDSECFIKFANLFGYGPGLTPENRTAPF